MRVLTIMTIRQQSLFHSVVRQYVRTGDPVGSVALRTRMHAAWSPATIRAELAALEEDGYLSHPHTSAGRVPTTSGFRYYVDYCIERAPEHRAEIVFRRVARTKSGNQTLLPRALAHALAELTGALALVSVAERSVHESGLGNVLRMRELAETHAAEDLARLLEALLDRSEDFAQVPTDGPAVFINGENPLVESRCTSMVVVRSRLASGNTLLAALIGPVRMPYERHWRVLRSLETVLQTPVA